MSHRPEILSPAGNPEKLRYAVDYGADAVYCALDRFGLRAAAENFTPDELQKAVTYAHSKGSKVYVTMNVMPHDDRFDELREYFDYIKSIRPDALIIADAGVLYEARKALPDIPIHLSTQASTLNSSACRFWAENGVSRIVLARELSLAQITQMRKNIPQSLEFEAFVHGAMCVAYSGRCLLSSYLTGRSANEGKCTQPCRWHYFVTEEKRGDTPLPIEQDSEGSYLFSSKDMCMIEHIPELTKAGIASFKIEGRVKSVGYTAAVTNAYKCVLDEYLAKGDDFVFDTDWLSEVLSVSHREYSTGFYFGDPLADANIVSDGGYIRDRAFLATVEDYDDQKGLAFCIQRNKMCRGDMIDILSPHCKGRCTAAGEMFDADMQPIDSTPHPMMRFYLRTDGVKKGDIIRGV